MGDLTGKIAVVTGAGKGIGAAIAARFLKDNIKGIALLDFDGALAEQTASRLDSSKTRALPLVCDVSDSQQVKNAVSQACKHFGTVDILVNNAGITKDRMFHKMEQEAWDAVMNVNLNGAVNLCREIIPIMRQKTYGKIVNISSTSAFGNAGQANYAASKSALIGFTKALAKECGAKNITANCIAPGFINTDMFNAVPDEIIKQYLAMIPMNRLAEPEEVAAVVSFFASDDSSFVSGQCLIMSGGAHT
jgi:3-oxoacyl-[acyl-carrier protein] reductase